MRVSEIIRTLKLKPHPEGGHYREIGRSQEVLSRTNLPARYDGDRSFYTTIYYLIQRGEISRLHRLQSDEIWCLLAGGRLILHRIDGNGRHTTVRMGSDLGQGDELETIVPRSSWLGARLEPPAEFALASCTVIPGFEFRDFELGSRDRLLAEFPDQREIIELLT